ncbi:hypothetical protein KAT08_04635 [Candidatus Babeliales bacterium]|nr:hypothetical protein [Candidatus Babeliales bacterium]
MMEINKDKDEIKKNIILKTESISTHLLKATVKICPTITKKIHDQTVSLYQKQTHLSGYRKYQTPIKYLEENYKNDIENNVKNFLFKHIILDFLIEQIHNQKISLVNYPRLKQIDINATKQANFVFNLSVAEPIELKEWKNFAFRAPKRKKYKDLDKQVNMFIKKEISLFKKNPLEIIQEDDWVCFDAILLNEKNKPVIEEYGTNSFWIKINNKYIKKPFQLSLMDKKTGDTLISNMLPITNEFSSSFKNEQYPFLIKIKKITKGRYFWIDSFKANFRLKSKQEVHKKLIEVFSYRNDISQRKTIIEELFHLLLSKHRFEIPKHFVIRRQENILNSLKEHPDYQVYKLQKDFERQITALAEKQLKEEIIMDQIGYKENIKIEDKDIQNYLHLFNNNKLKEFVYFKPIIEKIEESDYPLPSGLLKQAVFREKTLNHMIYVLTK